MALFQKTPITEATLPLYTVSAQKTLLIVGLGNPDDQYRNTRHNIGFTCLDAFAKQSGFPAWIHKKDLHCLYAQHTLGHTRVMLIKPTTYMNLSGKAVQAVCNFFKIPTQDVIVLHDELDIPFGTIRCRIGGSSAGHNGVRSVTESIGEAYGRIRIGIGPKTPEQIDSSQFVLAAFSQEQAAHLKMLTNEVTALLTETIFSTNQLAPETRSFTTPDTP